MNELTESQRNHLLAAFLFAELSRMTIIDYLLISATSDKESTEEWALNGLRSYGEIRKKYKDNQSLKEVSEFVAKILKFYFEHTEETNGR